MGLDMYLRAERHFAPERDEAQTILNLVGLTATDLEAMSLLSPMEHETAVYLSRWGFERKSGEGRRVVELAEAVEEAAGLLAFATPQASGGYLSWKDGKIAVSIDCMYWRKANAIHNWFVENCQDGIDECQESDVHPEKLIQLRFVCADALSAYRDGDIEKAREILTPTSGFFFGGTDVDEWWAEDTAFTISEIDRVIGLAASTGGVHFTYRSSW